MIVIGTREELAERVDQDVNAETIDLHRPSVDDLTITENGTTYTRVPDVFDVWIDSSVATWGTLDYPESEERFEDLWPADLIIEAHDQTRGWFWSQLGMGTAALDMIPYEEVLMHGWALAEDGRKMSKSVGNIVEPSEAIERHGADPMRVFLLSVTPQGEDMRFSWDEMETAQRDLNILWNVFRFPLPYMELDGYDPSQRPNLNDSNLEVADRWILSKLQGVIETASDRWREFEPHKALDELREFIVEDLSRYYVQLVRERMWAEENSPSKLAAYDTLTECLHVVVRLLAPYAPFITEHIYEHLTGPDGHPTVHMCDWPTPDGALRNPDLEAEIDVVRRVEEAGSNARQQAGRKLRWPVKRVIIDGDKHINNAVNEHRDLLSERLNAREIVLTKN
ncbi:MAG: class I tRNA ligase family protein, partial [Halobacteriaceae archaeon]